MRSFLNALENFKVLNFSARIACGNACAHWVKRLQLYQGWGGKEIRFPQIPPRLEQLSICPICPQMTVRGRG